MQPLQPHKRPSRDPATGSARATIGPATCPYSLGSSRTKKWLRSFAMEPTASASLLWRRVGACPGPPQFGRSADHQHVRNVASPHWRGLAWQTGITAASYLRLRFAEIRRYQARARRRSGSRSAKTDRCSPLLVCGPPWRGVRGPKRARQPMGNMSCSVFSRQNRTPSSPQVHPKAMPVILTTPAERSICGC